MKKFVFLLTAICLLILASSALACRAKILAYLNVSSPGGSTTAGNHQEVIRFDLSNPNNFDVRIDEVICRMTVNGKKQGDDRIKRFYLYKSFDLAHSLAYSPEENAGGRLVLNLETGEMIARQTIKTMVIKADSTGFHANETLSIDIIAVKAKYRKPGTGRWRKLKIANLPILGNALVF